MGSKGQYLADNPHLADLQYSSATNTDMAKSLNAPSIGGWVVPQKKDVTKKKTALAQPRKTVTKKQSSTFYKRQQEATRNQAYTIEIQTGTLSQPSATRNVSETKSRNLSVMEVTHNPLDMNLTKESRESTLESEKSRKTTLSYMGDTGKLRHLTTEPPTSLHKKKSSNRKLGSE